MDKELGQIIGIPLFILAILVYILPSVVARGKKNANAIIALNLLTGWTCLGWLVAFIWALTKDEQKGEKV